MGTGISGLYTGTSGAISNLIYTHNEVADFFLEKKELGNKDIPGQLCLFECQKEERRTQQYMTVIERIRKYLLNNEFYERSILNHCCYVKGNVWFKIEFSQHHMVFILRQLKIESIDNIFVDDVGVYQTWLGDDEIVFRVISDISKIIET